MNDESWQPPRPDASGPDTGVRWQRYGAAVELRFDIPAGDPTWRQSGGEVESIPIWNAVTAGGVTGGAVALGSVYAVPWLGTLMALPALPAWLGLAVGAVAVPVAAGAGWLTGRRQREHARARRLAAEGIADALGSAFGGDFSGRGARSLVERIVQAMRTGERQRAHVLTSRGHGVFRVEPIDGSRVRVEQAAPDDGPGVLGRLSRAVSMPTAAAPTVTAEAESRRALLQQRLERLRAAGRIDARHAAWPRWTILAVDRMTEFRALAARAERLAGIPSDDARETVERLVDDLDEVLELMRAGAEELEREVLDASERDSDAHLRFLREKYDAADEEHRRELGRG